MKENNASLWRDMQRLEEVRSDSPHLPLDRKTLEVERWQFSVKIKMVD